MNRLPYDTNRDPVPALLAPMSGVSDAPMRRLARRFGASGLVTEMVASERYAGGNDEEALKSAEDTPGAPYTVQLAGRDPAWMREAAIRAEAAGAAVIDINMGCPARRVVGGYSGSALMRDLDLATQMIARTIEAVGVAVTVKMRLGWDDASRNAPELAARAEALGARMIVVHGRTRCQFYQGEADWAAVRETTARVSIPVLVNGDIDGPETALDALRASGAAGVMVGRAAVGRPWLPGQIAARLNGRDWTAPDAATRLAAMLEQFDGTIAIYGPRKGVLSFRKHASAYLKFEGAPRELAERACRADAPGEARAALTAAFEAAQDWKVAA